VKTDIVCEKGVPEGEGGFSAAKMINVYRYAIGRWEELIIFCKKRFAGLGTGDWDIRLLVVSQFQFSGEVEFLKFNVECYSCYRHAVQTVKTLNFES
jgi:hypothetical protein